MTKVIIFSLTEKTHQEMIERTVSSLFYYERISILAAVLTAL